MKIYKTIQVVNLTAGVLKLSKDQARRRRHLIKPVEGEKDVYKIVAPCQFKAGEKFGYEGFDLTPALARCFEGGEEALIEQRANEKVAAEKADTSDSSGKGSKIVGFFADLFGKKSDDELADDEQEFVALVYAIDAIDKDNADLWTKQSGPKLAALREASGRADIKETQRDSAWEIYQKKSEIEIIQAIGQLEKENPEQWTQDNKPDVKALEIKLGYDITAEQRDIAWDMFQQLQD